MNEKDKQQLEQWICRAVTDPEYLDTLSPQRLEELAEAVRKSPESLKLGHRRAKIREVIMRKVRESTPDTSDTSTAESPPNMESNQARFVAVLALTAWAVKRSRTSGARSSAKLDEASHGDEWDIALTDSMEELPVPERIAEHCYGVSGQSIVLRLVQIPKETDQFEMQLHLFPGPQKAPFSVRLTLADGRQRTVTVPVVSAPGRWVWSEYCSDFLPATSFGATQWSLQIELGEMQIEDSGAQGLAGEQQP